MKKYLFMIICFFMLLSSGISVVYANIVWTLGQYISFGYYFTEAEPGQNSYYLHYDIEYTYNKFYSNIHPSIIVKKGNNEYFALTFDPADSIAKGEKDSKGYDIYYLKGTVDVPVVLADGTDFTSPERVFIRVHGYDLHDEREEFEVDGSFTLPKPTATPKPTSTPKPTATPKPDPTATPKPTSTPTPKPTATPKPTPTNTPTPTPSPTPAPILRLDAAANNNTAKADYYTGGCTPIKSTIEFYEIDMLTGEPMKIAGESFISGSGSRSDLMEPGKLYRYKLTYVYERSGVQFTEVLWSIDLRCVDQELEDYRERGQVNNFRTLILCIWEEFMEIGIPIDGFNLKFRSFYIWIMIAGLAVFFFKKWNG